MTPETLIAVGYKKFTDHFMAARLGDWYQSSYQRRIRDEVGIRYFITITHGIQPAMDDRAARPFFTPSVQFTRNGSTFNVDMIWHGEDLATVEGFFADLWASMRCGYYEGGPNEERGYPQVAPPNLEAAARALSVQLHACMPAIDDAFKMQAVRGNWYEGPTFDEELEALDAALDGNTVIPSDRKP